jgi:hypothetical protein
MQPHVTASGGTGAYGGGLSSWQQDEILRQQELRRLQQQLQAQLRNPRATASTCDDVLDLLDAERARRERLAQAGSFMSGDAARAEQARRRRPCLKACGRCRAI